MLKDKPIVILLGSKPGATVVLSMLLKREWQVKYVVVSKSVNHPWISGQTVVQLARANNIAVITQSEIPRDEKIDFVISYMYRHLVKTDVIAMAKRAAVNFHAGPLPGYGGWAFYNMAILENVSEYGCTCHYMDEGFDTGPIFKVRRFPVNTSMETACSLERKTQQEMIKLFIDFCDIVETKGTLPFEEQDKAKIRYLTQSEFEALKRIPPEADEETIQRYSRAFWFPPYECAYTFIGETKVEVIPSIVKNELARMIHLDDLDDLQKVADQYVQRKAKERP
jgi:methionyl-tRNA formyltransferase